MMLDNLPQAQKDKYKQAENANKEYQKQLETIEKDLKKYRAKVRALTKKRTQIQEQYKINADLLSLIDFMAEDNREEENVVVEGSPF